MLHGRNVNAAAIVFARKGDDWVTELLASPDAVLNLPQIGLHIPLGELYADLDLGTESPDEAGATE
jgi:hypothetical protein